ncbi:MAG: hypothetical protein HQK51_16720 [Oligoflexia bacterium]|nr:hypothetical protein [Oligoflexia bacterium]
MKSFDEIKSALSETQRYIKLTRALIISRVLNGLSDLDKEQRTRMNDQLNEIKKDLGMSNSEFNKAISDLEQKHDQEYLRRASDNQNKNKDTKDLSNSSNSSADSKNNNDEAKKEKEEVVIDPAVSSTVISKKAYCLNKKCRNKFTVNIIPSVPVNNKCSICGSDSALLLEIEK